MPPPTIRAVKAAFVWVQSALLCLFAVLYFTSTGGGQPALRKHASITAPNRIYELDEAVTVSGPFGTLEIVPIITQAPPALASLWLERDYGEGADWRFRGATIDDVRACYRQAGLGPADVELLARLSRVDTASNTVVTTPPVDWLIALTPERRRALHAALRAKDAYTLLRDPYSFPGDDFGAWTEQSNLSPDTLRLLEKLAYRDGHALVVCDMHAIHAKVNDPNERIRIERTLSRTPSLSIQLLVDEGADVDAIVAYWGVRGRRDSIAPMVEALARKPGGGRIDIVHFLPRFARVRLNSYLPVNEYALTAQNFDAHDCKWTSFNFFNDVPDERFASDLGSQLAGRLTRAIDAPTRFGDIIMLLDRDDQVCHTCVHVAGDVVFTKNGASPHAPFILSFYEDVRDAYAHFGVADVLYRRLDVDGVTQSYKLVANPNK